MTKRDCVMFGVYLIILAVGASHISSAEISECVLGWGEIFFGAGFFSLRLWIVLGNKSESRPLMNHSCPPIHPAHHFPP